MLALAARCSPNARARARLPGVDEFFPRSNLGRFARPCTLCKEGLPRELSGALPRMGGCGTWMGRRGAHPGEASTTPGERRPLSQGGFYPFSGCPGTFVWAAPLAMGAIGRFLGRTGASRGEHRTFCGKGRTFHGKRSTSRVHPWGLTREALYRTFTPPGLCMGRPGTCLGRPGTCPHEGRRTGAPPKSTGPPEPPATTMLPALHGPHCRRSAGSRGSGRKYLAPIWSLSWLWRGSRPTAGGSAANAPRRRSSQARRLAFQASVTRVGFAAVRCSRRRRASSGQSSESDPLGWMSSAAGIAAVVFASSPRSRARRRPGRSSSTWASPYTWSQPALRAHEPSEVWADTPAAPSFAGPTRASAAFMGAACSHSSSLE